MIFREPAGWERKGGRSAEFHIRARMRDGIAENICGTVCGLCRRGAIC